MDKEVLRQMGWKIPPDELPEEWGEVEVLMLATAEFTPSSNKWWGTGLYQDVVGWRYKTSLPSEARTEED